MNSEEIMIRTLRSRGHRITPQREMIIRALGQSEKHMSAEEIFAEVSKSFRSSNIATVYRTLELLFKEGLACRNNLGGGKIVYAALSHGTHIHLVCRQCGQVIDADYQLLDPLAKSLQAHYAFQADLMHISIYGLCHLCQKKAKAVQKPNL